MTRQKAQYPYDEYYLYIVFHKKEQRRYANLISIKYGKKVRKTISYARYLMSVKEGRILEKWEQVDHKDNDKLNDDPDNLQILTVKQNNDKEALRRGSAKMVSLRCPWCKKIFDMPYGNTHLGKKVGHYTSCSRSCSAHFTHYMRSNPESQDVLDRLNNNVLCIYHRGQKPYTDRQS